MMEFSDRPAGSYKRTMGDKSTVTWENAVPDISKTRISEILRLVFDLLWFEPQGLYISEIIKYIQATLPLSDFETGYYPWAPYSPRYEVIIRVGSIPLVKAGWLEKSKQGLWFITDAGREACKNFKTAEDFFEESIRLFVEWKSMEKNRLAQFSSNPFSFAMENSWELIRQYIDSLDMHEVRAIVNSLMKAMGHYLAWSGSIGDESLVDFIYYLDPLGFKQPRLVVHVGATSQVSTIEHLELFRKSLQPEDIGIFVALGSLTTGLKDQLLTQKENRVRLIDMEKFIDLWVEHSGKLSPEEQSKFPLKPVYFLSFLQQV